MKAIKVFGADHVIMGSDTPYGKNNLSDNIKKVRELKITKEEKSMIMGENMWKLLSLWHIIFFFIIMARQEYLVGQAGFAISH